MFDLCDVSLCKAKTQPVAYIIKQMNDSYDMHNVDMGSQPSGKCVFPEATDLYTRPHRLLITSTGRPYWRGQTGLETNSDKQGSSDSWGYKVFNVHTQPISVSRFMIHNSYLLYILYTIYVLLVFIFLMYIV